MAGLTTRQHSSESNKTALLPGSCARVTAEPSSAGTRASKHQQHLPHGSFVTRSCAQGSARLPPALRSELCISCQGHLASKVCSYGPTAAGSFQTRLLHNACLQLGRAVPASWRADSELAQHRAALRAQSSPGQLGAKGADPLQERGRAVPILTMPAPAPRGRGSSARAAGMLPGARSHATPAKQVPWKRLAAGLHIKQTITRRKEHPVVPPPACRWI